MSDVTSILNAIEHGAPHAGEQLLPLLYEELRRLAAQKLGQEKPGQTLQATALVHEAYLRLVDVGKVQHWNSKGHFFAAAAEAMRRILVENFRRKRQHKRGGGRRRLALDDVAVVASQPSDDVLALNEAVDRLAKSDPTAAEVVKLRYFAGLSMPEVAAALRLSLRTAERHWTFARAWLHRELVKDESDGTPESR
jgi:RNA polymerase sigma factor (TIGR02999 family)